MHTKSNVPAGSGRVEPCSPEEPIAGNYFVSTYPPFSTWSSNDIPTVSDMLGQKPDEGTVPPLGLYVHIPFCVERCHYCYYLSSAGNSKRQMTGYADALSEELTLYCRTPALAGRNLSFVYFGGGTPSMLPVETIRQLMTSLQSAAPWSSVKEATFECAPKTVTLSRLSTLKDAGITRISLGVQALDDDVLKKNGRVHLTEDVERAYAVISKFGFPITNIDLIAGLVGETEASFIRSLDRAIAMQPESVTIYQLEIPLNTPLYHSLSSAQADTGLATWDEKHRRLGLALSQLESAGYHVQTGYTAVRDPNRHPFIYQDAQYHGADLLGIGQASFSYIGGLHFQNVTTEEDYYSSLRSGALPIKRAYRLNDEERLVREFILQLKLGRIDCHDFELKFGVNVRDHFSRPLDELSRAGWIEQDREHLTLTRAGLLRVDRLLERFYLPRHRHVRYS